MNEGLMELNRKWSDCSSTEGDVDQTVINTVH